jgi:DNA primase
MSKRPYVSFAEVKEKVPIPEALDALGLSGRFQRKGGVITGVCPLPAHKHGPSPNPEQFKINRRDGTWLWHCFGDCQRGGDVVELVKEITGYDDAHVRFWFAEKFGDRLTLAKPKPNGRPVEKDTTCEDHRQIDRPQAAPISPSNLPAESSAIKPLRFRLDLDPDVPYLANRGLKLETICRYGIGLCRRGVLKGYIAIPVYGWPSATGDNPVAYLGRWPSDAEQPNRPRYKWPEGFFKERIVFGIREALSGSADEPLLVVEGPLAVLHLVQVGFTNAVAVCGSFLSDEQAEILIGTGRSIVLLFDGDEAGQNGMRTAAAKLITRRFVRVIKLPEGKQPDNFSAAELAQLLF